MTKVIEYVRKIDAELEGILGALDQQELDSFLENIESAKKIALHGVGREGLMMRAFAMRLFHLGYDVSVVGDMTAPYLAAGDLLIISAGPGYFATIDGLRAEAQRDGARVFCLTAQRDGKTPQACDGSLLIPAQTMADDQKTTASSILPMGSLYELAMFALFEIIVLELLKRTGRTFGAARERHTNLE
ncbi:MAG TPA: SIS domain-containing protein [Terrimicrobiaceae bacterium]